MNSQQSFRLGLPTYMDQIVSGEVKDVALSNRGIDTEICKMLAAAVSRSKSGPRVIDLNDNGINDDALEMLVDALRENKNVTELHLMNNMISDRGAEVLLQMLQEGSNIRTIAVGGNKVSESLVKQLEEVSIINTQPVPFRRVAGFLRSNDPRGDVLEIYDDRNTLSLSLFKSAVANSEHLKVLRLVNCGLADGGCGAIADIIPGRKGLEVLDLSRNGITSHGLRHLIDALSKNTSVKTLILNQNRLTDEASRAMCEMLRTNNSITTVEVNDNAISAVATGKLQHAVMLNSEPLQLKEAYYAAQINDPAQPCFEFQWVGDMSRGATVLAPVLKTNKTVTTLNLSNSRMGDAGLRALLPVLASNQTLKTLEMANCNITSNSIQELAKVLESSNTGLQEINVANNNICNVGGKSLAQALLINWSMHIINLELNELAPELMDEIEGLLAINRQPRALKKIVPFAEHNSDRLTQIDLSQYDGDQYHNSETARILALSLRGNSHCKSVNLSSNPIGDDGGVWIGQLIAANTGVEHIILEDCAIGDRGAVAIAEALASNTRLLTVTLRNNHLGNVAGEALLNYLGEPNDTLTIMDVTKTRIIQELRECIEAAAALNTQPGTLKRILPQLENQSPVRHRVKNLPPSPKKLTQGGGEVQKKFKEISFRRQDPNTKALTDVAVQMLMTQLSEDDTVESLDLSGNALTFTAMKYLAEWLARPQTKLTHLNLARNHTLKDDGIVLLARQGLAKNQSLKELDLTGTGFTSRGLDALVQALKPNDTIIAVDYDETSDMSKVLRTEFVRELALNTQNLEVKRLVERIITNDPTLTVLDLGNKRIGDLSVKLLSLALVHNTTVVAVDFAGNDISSAGIDFFGDLLEDNKTIESCSLENNNIDERGAQFLIRVLAINNSLKELDMSGNNDIPEQLVEEIGYMIRVNNGPIGFKKSMSALVSNSDSLTSFDGCGKQERTKYDDESTHVLCSLLVDNNVVKKLDLSHNNIGDKGAQLLSDTLRVNRTICELDLSFNKITAAGVEALYNALKSNTVLIDINLDGNPVPKQVVEILDGPLNINRTPYRSPARPKGHFKERPPVTEIESDKLLKDIDYLRDVDDQIYEDGCKDCPSKEKINEIFVRTEKLRQLTQTQTQLEEIKSLDWNKKKSQNENSREKEFAETVSPLPRMLTEQKQDLSHGGGGGGGGVTGDIDDEL